MEVLGVVGVTGFKETKKLQMEKDVKSDSGDELLCSETRKSMKDLF